MTEVLSMIGAIIGLAITAATFILKFVKSVKAEKAAEAVIQIGNAVLPFMKEAETFTKYSGREKKEYVLIKANEFAVEHGMPFDAEQVSVKIEELIALTKTVNKRQKDKLRAVTANADGNAQCVENEHSQKPNKKSNQKENLEK